MEYKVRDILKTKGYFVVRQAKSTFPDLVALKGNEIVFIECKVNKYLSRKEKEKIKEIKEKVKCKFLVAYNDKGKVKFYEV